MKYTNTISNFDDLFSPSVNQNNLSSLQPDFATSNIQSLIQFTIPDGKLFYPEPFIASPSYLHSDLSYLHIFQY